jgi:hypothetical protein
MTGLVVIDLTRRPAPTVSRAWFMPVLTAAIQETGNMGVTALGNPE